MTFHTNVSSSRFSRVLNLRNHHSSGRTPFGVPSKAAIRSKSKSPDFELCHAFQGCFKSFYKNLSLSKASRIRSRTILRVISTMKDDKQVVVKDLVLVGGGHSHVHILKNFGMNPMPGVRITLVARDVHTPYSGMLPGHVAGHYTWEQCHVDLRPLCQFSGARLVHASATALDRNTRTITLQDHKGEYRPALNYDVLSINIGITPAKAGVKGADHFTTPVKPINGFSARWEALVEKVKGDAGQVKHIVVVGGGAGGTELLLSMKYRLGVELNGGVEGSRAEPRFSLVTRGRLLASHPQGVRSRFMQVLRDEGVGLEEEAEVVEVRKDELVLKNPSGEVRTLEDVSEVIWCTAAGAQSWLAESGLDVDQQSGGFMRVHPTLESLNTPNVFGCGDVANVVEYPRPKAGVFAVRQGPPLAANLRRALLGEPLEDFVPQSTFMGLISTGGKYAIYSKGNLAFGGQNWIGRYLWQWKDQIDRTWMYGYSAEALPDMSADDTKLPLKGAVAASEEAQSLPSMRCGGCGAKVGADVLSRVMARIQAPIRDEVEVGLDSPDDAALVRPPNPETHQLVHTVDFFRSFLADPFLFGQIAAVHSLGDCWAMGAQPVSALATAQVPYGLESKVESDLFEMMAGACHVLRAADCALVGGHSSEGTELALGFSVTGTVARGRALTKAGLKPGHVLVLTKALGTGALFAADMRCKAKGWWIEEAIESMRQPSDTAAKILIRRGCGACTDVTGFGLAGHLLEMARASRVTTSLDLDALPLLAGAADVTRSGIVSSLQPQNQKVAHRVRNIQALRQHAAYPLIFDPQTSGGLLASIPADQAEECVKELQEAGYHRTTIIGTVVDADVQSEDAEDVCRLHRIVAQSNLLVDSGW